MDHAKVKRILRGFWMIYGCLTMVFSLAALFSPRFGASMLIICALGGAVFWAAWRAPEVKVAAALLKGIFILIILQCIVALLMGDVMPPLAAVMMLIISVSSLIEWRGESALKK